MSNIKFNSSELLSDNIRILAIPKMDQPSFTYKSSEGQQQVSKNQLQGARILTENLIAIQIITEYEHSLSLPRKPTTNPGESNLHPPILLI
jgi:hypothetical protein